MDANEKFVREHWELVHYCDGSYQGYPPGTILVQDAHGHWIAFESAAAAAEFTRERLEQIRQVEEEVQFLDISVMHVNCGLWDKGYISVIERILAREQAALDALKKGMK